MPENGAQRRTPTPITNCPDCAAAGERGSCARLRCYCGHPACWAYPSWQPVRTSEGEQ